MSQNKHVLLKKILRFLFGIPLTFAAFFFIAKFLWDARDTILNSLAHANYFLLILGVTFFAVFFFLKNIVWIQILRRLGAKNLDESKSFFLLSFSETKRYIPGNIFSFIARVQSYRDAQIPTQLLVKSIVIEQLLLMIPSIIVSLPGLVFIYPRLLQKYPEYGQYIPFVFVSIIVFSVLVIAAAGVIAKKKLGVKQIDVMHIAISYFPIFCISILSWIFFGIGNYFVAASVQFLNPEYFLALSSFFVLAWFVGFISIVTPMGLGVREGVLILGLSPLAPLSATTLIALFSRVCFMAGEFLFLGLAYILYANKYAQHVWSRAKKHAHSIILFMGIIAYAVYFSYLSIIKYLNFFMGKFDLGNMDQTVWNTLNGRIFMFTNPDSAENISRLAFHADFILILLTPFYLLWEDPRMLLIIQSIVLAAGAYFVFRIAQLLLKNKNLALIFSFMYLLSPIVQRQNLYDFHAVTLATTFLLATWYFFLKKKFNVMTVFLVLAVLCKENIYLIATLFGLFLMYRKNFRFGVPIAAVSIAIFFLLMKKFIPDARGGEHFAIDYLSAFGDSTTDIAKNIILNPFKTISVFIDNDGLEYLNKILLPVGYLPLLSPVYMIFAGPDILKNVLSSNSNFRDLAYQYNAEIVPFLLISSIYSVKLLLKKTPVKIVMYLLVGITIFGTWMYGTLPGSKHAYIDIFTKSRPYAAEIRDFLETIEPNASVTSTNNLGSHLSQREHIYVMPQGVGKADYVLFLVTEWYDPQDAYRQMIEELAQNPQFELVYTTDNFYAFKRITNYSLTTRYSVGK